jgi:hypothetical protein
MRAGLGADHTQPPLLTLTHDALQHIGALLQPFEIVSLRMSCAWAANGLPIGSHWDRGALVSLARRGQLTCCGGFTVRSATHVMGTFAWSHPRLGRWRCCGGCGSRICRARGTRTLAALPPGVVTCGC